jgi:hypothetical protein
MEVVMAIPPFDDHAPTCNSVTSYDERHLTTYLRLLGAAEDGANWREAVRLIFGMNPEREPERARLIHDSHLARARWMTEVGYLLLLRPAH